MSMTEMNLTFGKHKQLKRLFEHGIYIAILLLLIPGFFYFELCIVAPAVVELWSLSHFVHITCATFLLLNIVGNMIFGMFTNTSTKRIILNNFQQKDWTLCTICECSRPPRAWHCNTCNICILKRDHHCTFLACCVGYYNHRYFILFTFYIFISMLYSFYYNVKFLSEFINWNHGFVVIKFIFPLFSFVVDFGEESIYIFLFVINCIVGLITGFLFFYHFNNLIKGRLVHEANTKEFIHNRGWKNNIIEVFGVHWYLTWISPFIHSQLPEIGIDSSFIEEKKE